MVQARSGGGRVDRVSDPAQGAVLAANFLDAYVLQFFTMGFFHGDPHPGNLFVMATGAFASMVGGCVQHSQFQPGIEDHSAHGDP